MGVVYNMHLLGGLLQNAALLLIALRNLAHEPH